MAANFLFECKIKSKYLPKPTVYRTGFEGTYVIVCPTIIHIFLWLIIGHKLVKNCWYRVRLGMQKIADVFYVWSQTKFVSAICNLVLPTLQFD